MENSKCQSCKYVSNRFTNNNEYPSNHLVFNCLHKMFIDEVELKQIDCNKYKNKYEPTTNYRFRQTI